ncbi:protein PIN-LIKES 3-like isoform X1 [Olea europaea var. sylvestris]|uniref:protein PIN-LIKES 3-like isoform X1 n=2 Tax=Olea europaea var. sylvestris TaxID=158386 RepID=UPI000C1D319E|nr:protein PIN-LIKES 3-like isoform X1 [Olea europaea var. sylvestris]XP_022879012.1 protein PIN-LIKES 3-like isoform X1 [Olea europaea var. sylvestris]XP_022879013.1 protein PIN-LIKES 3-like isoform X1 [Olea europaea var. sylvestris]XP_022879015.1 protein PIN-LIKES 3-like isoform X1 [Olea europaea var. sylvestris]XP_022879016.1 protein PIN-LIKES 3-like isoform X1 [Olea europaea var. sylvestris]
MGFLNLFAVSSMPVLKVLLVTGLGSYLALDHVNILGGNARKHLNNIVFFVFNPALISSNLAKTITYESMVQMWFMPFNILITFIIGSALGWGVSQITRAPPHLHGLVIGCCAAGNLGNMLLIIIPAVCRERGSPFGDPDVCSEYGMGYASLSMAIGAIYLWSYVYNIIRISSSRNSEEVEINDLSITKSSTESSMTPSGSSSKEVTEPLLSSNQLALPQTRFEEKPQVSFLDKIKQYFEMLLQKMNLKRLFAPSTIGAIAGFVVGLLPQIRRLLIGDTAPVHVIQDTALLLGDGAIPAVTLILGGNLLRGLKGSGIQKSVILGIIIVRYVALPLLGIVVVKGAIRFGLVHQNPLYEFVLLLQFALPPAMNIGTMSQLFGAGESECSVIMLWCYVLASLTLTLWSTLFLWLVA